MIFYLVAAYPLKTGYLNKSEKSCKKGRDGHKQMFFFAEG